MSQLYTCVACKGTFHSDWTDEEAWAEYERLYPGVPRSEAASVCDDCYKDFMEWKDSKIRVGGTE